MPYLASEPDGTNGTLGNPISADGRPTIGQTYVVPARQGRAVRMKSGQTLKLTNVHGTQVCDFFAIVDGGSQEFLSMEHCRTSLGRIYVREGDVLVTNRRRGLVEVTTDTSKGVHDILIASCDHPRYQELGASGYHDNCADNFRMSLSAIGETAHHIPCPFNIWMNIPVDPAGNYTWQPPVASAGDHIILRALADCLFVMSACPQDMTPVNGRENRPTELAFEVT